MLPGRIRTIVTAVIALLAASGLAASADTSPAPYAGQDRRAIKALSETDVSDLLAGRGWGLAKPAELNGYPGPAHLLELRDKISLTEEQHRAVETLFHDMQARAKRTGALYVDAERRLEAAFSDRTVDADSLASLVREAERLRAELRLVHLETHLKTLPLLTRHQVAAYARLRGYGEATHDGGHGGHKH